MTDGTFKTQPFEGTDPEGRVWVSFTIPSSVLNPYDSAFYKDLLNDQINELFISKKKILHRF